MKLIRFSVERYRSIIKRSYFSVFDKTVLIGPNNEGKSNILRALVCALNILELFATSPRMIKRDGKTITYSPPFLGRVENYLWENDYPISLQRSRGAKENKKSIFILEFQLNEREFSDFRVLTQTELKRAIIPIRLEVNGDEIKFTLNIPGHFYKKASEAKMIRIAKFITEKINICYIDAERTASTAIQSVASLLRIQIQKVEEKKEYKKLLEQMQELYTPELNTMSNEINSLLHKFIPSIKETKISLESSYADRRFYRRPQFDVAINDGENTSLTQKGSGVQSLVALFLAQYVSSASSHSENFILAIDEPESHLHPRGIHDIGNIINNIATHNQIIIATHSPILAQTSDPHKNIIVQDNRAEEAKKISDVRKILGVEPADNLSTAEMVVVVEGAADENMFPHMLALYSAKLKTALDDGRLIVSSCGGTWHMENYIRFLRHQLCNVYVFVDDDEAGKQQIENMKQSHAINDSEYTKLAMAGLRQSEIENLFDPSLYAGAIAKEYGLDVNRILNISSSGAKWSDYMREMFSLSGKTWDNATENNLKTIVSEIVKRTTPLMFIDHRKTSFEAGCVALENKLY